MKSSMTMATVSSFVMALLFSPLLSMTVVAQSENGSISGTVKDSAGAAVSGAAVSLMRAHAILRTTQTGADGKFVLDNVAPGSYAVVVTGSGFGAFSSATQVLSGEKKELNVELEVNPLSEAVIVTAEAGQVSNARG
jgi:hypothetical protein